MKVSEDIRKLQEFIKVARGEQTADLVLKNVNIINVLSGEIHDSDVAVFNGRIVGLGRYRGKVEMNLGGSYLAPGFIDAHVHMESSKLLPWEYASAVVPRGTTGIVADPHEIANVLGLRGIELMLELSSRVPLSVYLMLPSCVPSTDLETSGARLSSFDLAYLLKKKRVLGIAEIMSYPGLLAGEPGVLEKVLLGKEKRVDGHAPGLTGKDLCAYTGAGIRSDHECTSREEAEEKLRLGMHVMIREGSAAKNLIDIFSVIKPENSRQFLFATDDRSPEDIVDEGHLDFIVRKSIDMGINPVTAIQMATINAASYFKMDHLGAIAPGYQADMVVLEDLSNIRILKVFKSGELIAENGMLLPHLGRPPSPEAPATMNVDWSGLSKLCVAAEGKRIKVMELIPGRIINRLTIANAKVRSGHVVSDLDRDILKVAVIERHRASGNVGVGFVRGFGLKKGALGSSVAHDSHNIVVLGTNDEEMRAAAYEVAGMRGGQVVVQGGKRLAALPLPIAGLMSNRSLNEIVAGTREIKMASKSLGCRLDDPFMALSFLALPVIPDLRVTDRGLVDVNRFGFVPLFGEN